MANVFATKSGNWSDTTVWNTGALPTTADDVFANNFVVNVDTSPTVLTVRNTSATGIAAGGRFELLNGVTLTCTASVGVVQTASTVPVVFSQASPAVATLRATIRAGAFNSFVESVRVSGTGTFNLVGGITQNNLPNCNAMVVSAVSVINITGNVAVPGNSASDAINLTGAASGSTINVTGDLICILGSYGGGSYCIRATGSATVNITGNCRWDASANLGSGNGAFLISGGGTITITGNVTGSTLQSGFPTISHGGTVTCIGTVEANVGRCIDCHSLFVTGPLIQSTSTTHPIYSINWRWHSALTPTYYAIRNRANTAYRNLWTSDNTSSGAGQPATNNVRSGTVYGPTSEYTGTCAVPAAGSVALGVPVDNTTGTAILTAADVQTALTAQGLTTTRAAYLDNLDATVSSRLASASYTAPLDAAGTRTAVGLATANLDTQLSPLPNLDTTVSSRLSTTGYTTPPTATQNASAVRTELSTELARIDTTVSSRLAGASYQTPLDAAGTRAAVGLASANLDSQLDALPTAVENASAVRAELATELGRIDVATSTRSTFNPSTDIVSQVTLVDTTTNLTNPPDVPTTTEIADAVRVELTPELDRIDVDVSSRLASVDYTTPPTALENAQAVEVQLSLPLGNMDVAVSTRSTFDPATDTVAQVTLVDTTTNLTNPPVVPTPEQIAEAVRTELTPELDRVSNCATVATTGQQIQNALSV